MQNKVFQLTAWTASLTAIIELALSQLTIRMTRLSAIETTGIFFFAFIISGLVTLFAVTRMKDNPLALIFAVLMNIITALAATWYLRLLFSDGIFLRNLYYVLNKQTQKYELLSLGGRISASVPLAVVMLGAAAYYLCGLIILTAVIAGIRKK
jgi:uncharacterized membrane protein HdeD (DUF308 family)